MKTLRKANKIRTFEFPQTTHFLRSGKGSGTCNKNQRSKHLNFQWTFQIFSNLSPSLHSSVRVSKVSSRLHLGHWDWHLPRLLLSHLPGCTQNSFQAEDILRISQVVFANFAARYCQALLSSSATLPSKSLFRAASCNSSFTWNNFFQTLYGCLELWECSLQNVNIFHHFSLCLVSFVSFRLLPSVNLLHSWNQASHL